MDTENNPQGSVHPGKPRRRRWTWILGCAAFLLVLLLVAGAWSWREGYFSTYRIPTGAMAETLRGHHKNVTCPACGSTFPVTCTSEVEPPEGMPPIPVTGCTCPNCRLPIRLVPDGRTDERGSPLPARAEVLTFAGAEMLEPSHPLAGQKYREIADPGRKIGDRIRLRRFLFDKVDPARLDLVVFEYPNSPKNAPSPLIYVKRLIGLPGETIAIHRGDVYHLPTERMNWAYDDSAIRPERLWDPRADPVDPRHPNDDRAVELFRQKQFQIIRKPPAVLLAMMRIVHDNDFQAADLKEVQRWMAEDAAWSAADENKTFRHETDTLAWLSYRHLLRGQSKATLITDFLGYNHAEHDGWDRERREWMSLVQRPSDGYNWVGDLIAECEVEVDRAEGSLVLQLARGADRFRAAFDLASGSCTLSRLLESDREEKLATQPTKLKKGKYQVRFANVDERLTVWVDNDLPFGDGVSYDASAEPGPTAHDLSPARIGASGGLTVRHLKLYRDTYYTANHYSPAENRPEGDDFANPDAWGPLRKDVPLQTYYVQPGHYFCMGDNSTASADSRVWGLVPRRLMLGQAYRISWGWGP